MKRFLRTNAINRVLSTNSTVQNNYNSPRRKSKIPWNRVIASQDQNFIYLH